MKKLVVIISVASIMLKATAQSSFVFQHLNTTNGLSYIGINDMCTDRKGNLWIATGNGLNMFNGKTVEKYYASEYPQLQNSNVIHVTCDSSNRIWVLTANGNVTMLDEKRQLHRTVLYEKNEFVKTRWILNSQHGSIILFTEKGHYALRDQISLSPGDSLVQKHFSFLPVRGYDTLLPKKHRQVFYYDDDNYLLVREEAFFKVNYRTKMVEKKYEIPHCTALVKWRENELLAYDRSTNEVKSIDLSTGQISFPFKDLKDQTGKPITAFFYYAEKIGADKYILTTYNEGIYIYNTRTRKIYNYRHNIGDPSSLGNNVQSTLAVGLKGWVFITCNPNGISYFNTDDFMGNQNIFADNKGNGYDGYIAGIATKDNNTYYAGTVDGMLEW
ncbi:MAG: two-component regulator propeller domain-containing protein [Bacteroidota bacterium]